MTSAVDLISYYHIDRCQEQSLNRTVQYQMIFIGFKTERSRFNELSIWLLSQILLYYQSIPSERATPIMEILIKVVFDRIENTRSLENLGSY